MRFELDDLIPILIKVLIIVLVGSGPLWLATRRSRKQFRNRFGRTPTDQELDSLGTWLKDPPEKPAQAAARQPTPAPPSPKTSFGNDPRA
jgi:hypothetical protein